MALDPCFCLVTSTPTPPSNPCPDKQKCCLKACDGTVFGADAVGPCLQVGMTDLSTLDHDISGCSGSVVYILESWDDTFFANVSLTSGGVLTWETLDVEVRDTSGEYSIINVRLQCTSSCDDLVLNSVFDVNVFVADNCTGVICDEGFECEPCGGDCDPIIPDVEIT